LLQIKVPAKTETGNVKAYFSGHYQTYGINVQAACDHQCRFVYAALAALGGTTYIAAYRKKNSMRWFKICPLENFFPVNWWHPFLFRGRRLVRFISQKNN